MKYFLFATILGFSAGGTSFLMVYGIDFYPVLHIAVPLYPLIMTYAIVNYKLMDIEVIVKKTLVFAGLFGFVMLAVTIIMALMQGIVSRYVSLSPLAVAVVTSLAVIILYDRTRKFLVNVTDRYLFQKKFDYGRLLKEVSGSITKIRSLNHLARLFVIFITMRARIKNAALFIRSEAGDFVLKTGRGVVYDGRFRNIPKDHALIQYLEKHNQALRRVEFPDELFTRLKAEAVIPSRHSLLFLGSKKSDEDYTDEDLDIVYTLAQEVAVAIENAKLYDQATERSKELERLNRELNDASEKLRKSLDQIERTNKELDENKAVVVEMKRRENLQRLAASIGHELNNSLAVFNMQCIKFSRDIQKIKKTQEQIESAQTIESAEALEAVIADEKDLLDTFERFYERVRAVADTVDSLLKAGSRTSGVSLKMILDYAFEELRFSGRPENVSDAEIEFDVPSCLPPVKGSAFRLQADFLKFFLQGYRSVSAGLEPDGKNVKIIFKSKEKTSAVRLPVWSEGPEEKVA